jgi:hypothetical protein
MSSNYASTQTTQQPEILALTYPTSNLEQAPPPLYPELQLVLATQELTHLPSEPPIYTDSRITRFRSPSPGNRSNSLACPRTTRPPTPNQPRVYPILPPIKRTRSADSPPTSLSQQLLLPTTPTRPSPTKNVTDW